MNDRIAPKWSLVPVILITVMSAQPGKGQARSLAKDKSCRTARHRTRVAN
jgi:hypothetical protein